MRQIRETCSVERSRPISLSILAGMFSIEDRIIAYATEAGNICRLVKFNGVWRFISIMVNNGRNMWGCQPMSTVVKAVEHALQTTGARGIPIYIFDNNLEFLEWTCRIARGKVFDPNAKDNIKEEETRRVQVEDRRKGYVGWLDRRVGARERRRQGARRP